MSVQTIPPASSAPPLLATSRAGAAFLAVIAPLGPLFMTLGLFVMPYGQDDDRATAAAKIMESPGAAQWAVLFILLSAFGSVGSLVVAGAIRLGSPRFGVVAAAIAFAGWIAGAYSGAGPIASIAAAPAAGLSSEETLALVTGVDGQVPSMVFGVLFVLLPGSLLLLGIAALIAARRRRYPLWAAILLTVAAAAVLVTGSVPGGLLPFAWIVVTVAYGVAGAVYAGYGRVGTVSNTLGT